MKKLSLIFLFSTTITLIHAQLCNEIADAKIKQIQEAGSRPENTHERAYDSLRKEMSDAFEILESCAAKNPSYEARSRLKKIHLYFSLSELAGQIGKYGEALKHIEAMERLLPSPNAISTSSVSSFSINGTKFTSDVPYTYIQSLYYQIIERRVNYYYFGTFDHRKVIEWYEKLKAAPAGFKPASLEALLYADALYKTGKSTAEYFPAMAKAVSLAGEDWAKKEEHDSAQINNRSLMVRWFEREMYEHNKARLNSADPGGTNRMLAARGLWNADEKELAKTYALSASEAGYTNMNDGLWYLDVMAGNDTKHIVAALNILSRSVYSLSESDMNRLLPLAEQYGAYELEEGIRKRLRKIANLRRRSTISLYPAVELIGLPCGHVPVSLNLRTGRVLQEFMFDYIWSAKTRYRFGRAFAKGEKGDRYEFSGWSAGYAISGILGKDFRQGNKKVGRSSFFSPAIGLDLRYSNWNFTPIVSDILNENDMVTQSNVTVNATTIRYEACYRTTFVFMTRYATIEYFLGFGIGYRRLVTAEGYDVEESRFRDARLNAARWNKIYMPLRLGVKVGLNVL